MPEWKVVLSESPELNALRWAMDADLPPTPAEEGRRAVIKFLVSRIDGLRVEVFSDEHPPPHFRVAANGEVANYTIQDCIQLNGGLDRHYRTIMEWHAMNKSLLIAAWNERRPSGCPVGHYRPD